MKKFSSLLLLLFTIGESEILICNPDISIVGKSVCEQITLNQYKDSSSWLPLEVGNTWHFDIFSVGTIQIVPATTHTYMYDFKTIKVLDSIYIGGLKYFKLNGFLRYPNGSIIRYDTSSNSIFINVNDSDYTIMNFSLPNGTVFQQIQPDGSIANATVVSDTRTILGVELSVKGFTKSKGFLQGETYQYFYPGIGFVSQNEEGYGIHFVDEELKIIEYLLLNVQADTIHQKHIYQADIQFMPVLMLPDIIKLIQTFGISHPLSVNSYTPALVYGRTYIKNAFFNSYYYYDSDTIYNIDKVITPNSETNFTVQYTIDTTLYNQGYHLYYRIAATDKGIIPVTYFNPDTGYYKLDWRDSTTNVFEFNSNEAIEFSLSQNYPNPFNPSTKISWQSPVGSHQTLKVYDVLGREVATLVNEYRDAGSYEVEFQSAVGNMQLASGVYYYQLKVGEYVETKKMLMLK